MQQRVRFLDSSQTAEELGALKKPILDPPILCLQQCVPISFLVPGLALGSPPGVLNELSRAGGSSVGCLPTELVHLSKWTEGPHGTMEGVGAGGLG